MTHAMQENHSARSRMAGSSGEIVLVVVLLTLTAIFFSYNLDGVWINDDEGQYIYEAWRIRLGEVPYRDFMTAQMPLFLYFGALVQWLAGHSGMALRVVTVLTGLATASTTWILGRRAFSPAVAILALFPFAVNDSVFEVVRVYRSDPYMMLWATVGLTLFVVGLPGRPALPRRRAFAWAGLCFGLAAGFKLFGLLSAGGCFLYLLVEAWQQKRPWRAWLGDMLALGTPLAFLLLLTTALFMALTPNFLARVLGHHLHQGSDLGVLGVLHKNTRFFAEYINNQPLFLALTALGIPGILVARQPRALAILCQAPTTIVFLFLSRPLGDRHLVYVFPALSLIWATGLIWAGKLLFNHTWRWLILGRVGLIGIAALATISLRPYVQRDLPRLLDFERDTPELVTLIERASPAGAVMVSDYQGLNFYTQRPGTYSSAGISTGAARSGQITADRLINEMETRHAHMVVLEFGATSRRLASMPDFDIFYDYVQTHFALIATQPWGYPRGKQWLEFFSRTDTLPQRVSVPFEDRLALTGYALSMGKMTSGGHIPVTLRWRGLTAMPANHSVSLKLVDASGNWWGQRDAEIAATRYRERYFGPEIDPLRTGQWRPGQTALQTLELPVRPEVPPGDYAIELTVYETQSLRPLARLDEMTGRTAQAYTLGHFQIIRPQPPITVDDLPIAQRVSAHWGPLELVGSGPLPVTARPGDRLHLSLFWYAHQAPSVDYQARLALLDRQGQTQSEAVFPLAGEGNPTSAWAAQEIWEGQYRLPLNPETPAGDYQLTVTVVDQAGTLLGPSQTLTTVVVTGYRRLFELPHPPQHPQQIDFGNIARLLGYDLVASEEGRQLTVTLYWQAQTTAEVSYTVFVHLLGSDGALVAQHDSQPQEGVSPTTSWLPGEIIVDSHLLGVPPGTALDQTRLEIGLYDATTSGRLSVRDRDGQPAGDAWLLPVTVENKAGAEQ